MNRIRAASGHPLLEPEDVGFGIGFYKFFPQQILGWNIYNFLQRPDIFIKKIPLLLLGGWIKCSRA
jgi:hypothetical protein